MRYLIFGGERSYPNGGWGDFKDWAQTVEQAKKITEDLGDEIEWAQIVDIKRHNIIWIGHDDGKYEGICGWRRPAHDTDFWGVAYQNVKV